jgi:hypothetical protein
MTDNLSVRFRNVHFVAKFHKSFKDYKLQCQLDKAKGLNIEASQERSFVHGGRHFLSLDSLSYFFGHLSFVRRCRSFQFFAGDRPLKIA